MAESAPQAVAFTPHPAEKPFGYLQNHSTINQEA
jgi:hypothetical protein